MPGAERPRALSLDAADARLVRVGGNEARIEADQIVHACIERVQRPGAGGKALLETDFGRARGLRTQRRIPEAREVEIVEARRSKRAPERGQEVQPPVEAQAPGEAAGRALSELLISIVPRAD